MSMLTNLIFLNLRSENVQTTRRLSRHREFVKAMHCSFILVNNRQRCLSTGLEMGSERLSHYAIGRVLNGLLNFTAGRNIYLSMIFAAASNGPKLINTQ